jgi:predicted TIM-barrel fold metal-dependent hydrolase
VREFLTRYQDRVIYATDFGLRDGSPEAGAKTLLARHARDWEFFSGGAMMDYEGRPTRGLSLPDAVLRKIFRENARRWLPGLGA